MRTARFGNGLIGVCQMSSPAEAEVAGSVDRSDSCRLRADLQQRHPVNLLARLMTTGVAVGLKLLISANSNLFESLFLVKQRLSFYYHSFTSAPPLVG